MADNASFYRKDGKIGFSKVNLFHSQNGVVDFNEFVDWWCLRCPIDKRSKD